MDCPETTARRRARLTSHEHPPAARSPCSWRSLTHHTAGGALGHRRATAVPAVRLHHRQRRHHRPRPRRRFRRPPASCTPISAVHTNAWVVFVDDFSGQPAVSWTENSRAASDLGDFDAILAVATVDHSYAFLVPLLRCRRSAAVRSTIYDGNQIELGVALGGDWSWRAAVAAANGLDRRQESGQAKNLGADAERAGVIAVAVLGALLFIRYRRGGSGAGQVPPHDESTPLTPMRWRRCRSMPSTICRGRWWSTLTTRCAPVPARARPDGRGVRRTAHRAVHPGGEQSQSHSRPSVHRAPAT